MSPSPPPFSGRPPEMKVEEMESALDQASWEGALALLLCFQLGQHWLLREHQDNLWSLQERARAAGHCQVLPKPLGHLFLSWTRWAASEAAGHSLTFPLPLIPSNLSSHITQPFVPETVLCKLWSPRRSNSYGRAMIVTWKDPSSSTCAVLALKYLNLSEP